MKLRYLTNLRPQLLLSCLTVLSIHVGAVAAHAEGVPGYVVLPLVLVGRSNQAMLRVKINDRSTMLILDTGATSIALDRRLYAAAQVRSNNAAPGQLPPEVGRKFKANGEPAEIGYIDSLKAGAAELGKRQVAVLDMSGAFDRYNSLHGQTTIGGLLGEDVLRQYSAIIDWGRHGVFFNIDPSKRRKIGAEATAGGWTAVPMSLTNYHHFTVQCEIGGKKARVIVDTGASYTSFAPGIVPITMRYNRLNDTSVGHLGTASGIMSMIGQDSTMHPGTVENWKIGNYEMPSTVVAVNTFPKGLMDQEGAGEGPILGLLGCEVLAKNHAIIDIGSQTLYLKHPSR